MAALLAMATLAAACGGGDGGGDADDSSGRSSPAGGPITTLETGRQGMGIPAAEEALGDGAGSTDAPGQGTAAPGGDDPPQERFGAPREGRYRYVVPGSEDEPDGRFFYWYGDLEHRGDSLLQAQQVAGDTFDNRAELIWTSTGDVLVAREQRSSQGEIAPVCDWEPDLLLYPASLEEGATWEAEATCTGQQGSTRTRTDDGRVSGSDVLDIGGVMVPVVVVERTELTTTRIGDLVIVERVQRTERFSEELGLRVAMEGNRTADFPGAPGGSNDFRERLVSTEPE